MYGIYFHPKPDRQLDLYLVSNGCVLLTIYIKFYKDYKINKYSCTNPPGMQI